MIKIEIFINEVSLKGQYSTQKEFEDALIIIKSIFELINSLKKENIEQKNYYTDVLWDSHVIKDVIFKESFNKIKRKDLKIAIRNIIFNKVNLKDWQEERIHSEEDNFDYLDGEDYKDAANTSLAEATERQLINVDSKYLLINFIDSCFQCQHQEIIGCNSISIVKNNDIENLIQLDSIDKKVGLENWLETSCQLSQFNYDESCTNPPNDKQTILRDTNRFESTQKQHDGRKIYKEKETGYIWYVDNLHYGKSAHLEVFDKTGKNHIGESDLEGKIDRAKSDKNKSV
ncbi:hypothetical protein [Okeania sp. SIO3B5]|uniref:hypothetical protein n=1 Tax=Okeania sp. SIO3B5 TaxID=2607811 RepID=UPI0025E3944F|nr:hypothetical protein [Okeania sp. SIO3B5]